MPAAVGGDLEWQWAFGVLPASWWRPATTLGQIAAKVESFAFVAGGDGLLVMSVQILPPPALASEPVGVLAGAGALRPGPAWPGPGRGRSSVPTGFDLASADVRVRSVLASAGN